MDFPLHHGVIPVSTQHSQRNVYNSRFVYISNHAQYSTITYADPPVGQEITHVQNLRTSPKQIFHRLVANEYAVDNAT